MFFLGFKKALDSAAQVYENKKTWNKQDCFEGKERWRSTTMMENFSVVGKENNWLNGLMLFLVPLFM